MAGPPVQRRPAVLFYQFEFIDFAHNLQVAVDRIGADKQRQENLLEFNDVIHCL